MRSDGGPVVRMRSREHGWLEGQIRHAVRPVLVALPALVLHDITLDVERLLVEGVKEETHPVGFKPQREFEVVGWHILPVVRPVRRSGAIEVRPNLLQWIEEAAFVVLGPLEHDMLEEVRETCTSRLLVLRADVIPDIDRRDGQSVVFVQDDVQAVGECEFFV